MYMVFGICVAAVPYYLLPLRTLYKTETQFILLAITGGLLFLTLLGTPINGSKRWLELGFLNFQVAELAKLVMIVFVADFVVRRSLRYVMVGMVFTDLFSRWHDNDVLVVTA